MTGNHFIKKFGFTFIELVVVVLIIAIFAAIAVPSFLSISNRAKESATKTEMFSIATAIALYMTENETYPQTESMLGLSNYLNKFMNSIPESDMWGSPYLYESDGSFYRLTSNGKDKTFNTIDDIIIINGHLAETGEENTSTTISDSTSTTSETDELTATLISTLSGASDIIRDVLNMSDTNLSWSNWNSRRNPVSWNQRIERLIQQGQFLTYDNSTEGTNIYGFVNPVSGKTSVYNWENYYNNWDKGNNALTTPPAVLITNDIRYDYNLVNLSESRTLNSVMGTVIIYKNDNNSDTVQIYYINAEGSKSELQNVNP